MSNFLVTGGAGFIGSHLVDALIEANHTVLILDNLSTGLVNNVHPKAQLIVGDIQEQGLVNHLVQQVDGVFHLAAIASVQASNEQWYKTHKTNLSGTINIFEAATKQKTPCVYASSAAVYGNNQQLPLTEDAATLPLTAYGADKLAMEFNGRVAWEVHKTSTVGLRFFNVYGPRQDPHSPYSGVISIFKENLLQKRKSTIFGDGQQTRDFIYVSDVVMCLYKSMELISVEPGIHVMNVCTGIQSSIATIYHCLSEILQLDLTPHFDSARQGDIRHSLGSNQRLQDVLGITEFKPVELCLQNLLATGD